LLDEPMTGLDPRGIRTMRDSILQQARAGAAFIISSHLLLQPLLKNAGYSAVVVATVVVSAAAYFLLGQRASAALAAGWLTLTAGGTGLVVLPAHAFDHFDVTRDGSA
jgi:ABC-type Na+ transport system ATPase subunit NatA